MRLVYILAASHSGSTLTSMLLGAHPQACTVGELKLPATAMGNLDRYLCSCGQRVFECDFWKKVGAGLRGKGIEFEFGNAGTDFRQSSSRYAQRFLRPLVRGSLLEHLRDAALWTSPTWRREYTEIQRRNAELVATVLELTSKRVIVDSSKLAHRLKFLVRNRSLDVMVVHLIRDGRAVALTYMDPSGFADAREPAKRGQGSVTRMSMTQAAQAWRRSNQEAEHVLARIGGGKWMRMRYEDLCGDPGDVLEGVLNFIGLNPNDAVLDFRSVEQHVIGNGMRLDSTSEIRLDDRWRQELTAEQLEVFDKVAGSVNRKYGYE